MARRLANDGGVKTMQASKVTESQPVVRSAKEKAPQLDLERIVDENKIRAVLQKVEDDFKSGKLEEYAKRERKDVQMWDKWIARSREKSGGEEPEISKHSKEIVRALGKGVLSEKEVEDIVNELKVIKSPLSLYAHGLVGAFGYGSETDAVATTRFTGPHEMGHAIHFFVMKKAVESGNIDDPVLHSLNEKLTSMGYSSREVVAVLFRYGKELRVFTETVGEAFTNKTDPSLAYKAFAALNFLHPTYWGALISSWSYTKLMEQNPAQFRELLEHPSITFGTTTFKLARHIDEQLKLSKEKMAGEWYNNFLLPLVHESEHSSETGLPS